MKASTDIIRSLFGVISNQYVGKFKLCHQHLDVPMAEPEVLVALSISKVIQIPTKMRKYW
jgi:hypothetical protein